MDALLAQLQKLSLPHEPIEHDVAMTVEDQVRSYIFYHVFLSIVLDNLNHMSSHAAHRCEFSNFPGKGSLCTPWISHQESFHQGKTTEFGC
jgi:hypothetical protein